MFHDQLATAIDYFIFFAQLIGRRDIGYETEAAALSAFHPDVAAGEF